LTGGRVPVHDFGRSYFELEFQGSDARCMLIAAVRW